LTPESQEQIQAAAAIVSEEARNLVSEKLREAGISLTLCADAADIYRVLSKRVPDALLLDAGLLAQDGSNIIEQIRREAPELPIITLDANPGYEEAVKHVKAGAFDYVPLAGGRIGRDLVGIIRRACDEHRLMVAVNQVQDAYRKRGAFGRIVGVSPAMQAVYRMVETVAATNATVFITGESGTGKELVADAIHGLSPRSGRFVPVNCAAIPQDLLESELFGHEKGSFTSAVNRRIGCCEQARDGTIFLDEVCEMHPALQSKLLRFLQDKTFQRVGGDELLTVDVRVIAATNRDPLEEVRRNRLREDLYYRLNVVPIELPPLRQRPEDVPILAQHFLEVYGEKYNKYFVDFSPEAMDALLRHAWPGNVRELEHVIERIVVLGNSSTVTLDLLPAQIRETFEKGGDRPRFLSQGAPQSPGATLEDVEREHIHRCLVLAEWDVTKAAQQLGISRQTLYRKMEKYSIRDGDQTPQETP